MIYTLEILTQPQSEPVTLQEMKNHLRVNDDAEDTLISAFIVVARQFFESYTGRAVHQQTFRQHVPYLNCPIYFMRAKLISVEGFFYYNSANTLTEITSYNSDLVSIPGGIWLDSYPITSSTKNPKAYVDYKAGWANNEVPEMVKLGIKLVASHYYENRNSHTEVELKQLPLGFKAIVDQFKTGMTNNWNLR